MFWFEERSPLPLSVLQPIARSPCLDGVHMEHGLRVGAQDFVTSILGGHPARAVALARQNG